MRTPMLTFYFVTVLLIFSGKYASADFFGSLVNNVLGGVENKTTNTSNVINSILGSGGITTGNADLLNSIMGSAGLGNYSVAHTLADLNDRTAAKMAEMGELKMIMCGVVEFVGDVVANLQGVDRIIGMFSVDTIDAQEVMGIGKYYVHQVMEAIEKPPALDFLHTIGGPMLTWDNIWDRIMGAAYTFMKPTNIDELVGLMSKMSFIPEVKDAMFKMNDVMEVVMVAAKTVRASTSGDMFAMMNETGEMAKVVRLMDMAPELLEMLAKTTSNPEKMFTMINKVIEDPSAVCTNPSAMNEFINMGNNSRLDVSDIVQMVCSLDIQALGAEGAQSDLVMKLMRVFSDEKPARFDAAMIVHNMQNTIEAVTMAIKSVEHMFGTMENGTHPAPRWMNDTVWDKTFERLGRHYEMLSNVSLMYYLRAIAPVTQLALGSLSNDDAQLFVRANEGLIFLKRMSHIFKGFPNEMFNGTNQLSKILMMLDQAPELVEEMVYLLTDPAKVSTAVVKLVGGVDLCNITELTNNTVVNFACKDLNLMAVLDEIINFDQGVFSHLTKMFAPEFYGNFSAGDFGHNLVDSVESVTGLIEFVPGLIENLLSGEARWMNGSHWEMAFGRIAGHFMSQVPANSSAIEFVTGMLPEAMAMLNSLPQEMTEFVAQINDGVTFFIRLMTFVQDFPMAAKFNDTVEMKKIIGVLDQAPHIVEQFVHIVTRGDQLSPLLGKLIGGQEICNISEISNISAVDLFCKQLDMNNVLVELMQQNLTSPLLKIFTHNYTGEFFNASMLVMNVQRAIGVVAMTVQKIPTMIADIENGTLPLPPWMDPMSWMGTLGRLAGHFESFANNSIVAEVKQLVPLLEMFMAGMDNSTEEFFAAVNEGVVFLTELMGLVQDFPRVIMFNNTVALKKIMQMANHAPGIVEEIVHIALDPEKLAMAVMAISGGVPICNVTSKYNISVAKFICEELDFNVVMGELMQYQNLAAPLMKMFSPNVTDGFKVTSLVGNIQHLMDETFMTITDGFPRLIAGFENGSIPLPFGIEGGQWEATFGRLGGLFEGMARKSAFDQLQSMIPLSLMFMDNLSPSETEFFAMMNDGLMFFNILLKSAPEMSMEEVFHNNTKQLKKIEEIMNHASDIVEDIVSLMSDPPRLVSMVRELSSTPLCELKDLLPSIDTLVCQSPINMTELMNELQNNPSNVTAPLVHMLTRNYTGVFNASAFMKTVQHSIYSIAMVTEGMPEMMERFNNGSMPVPRWMNTTNWRHAFDRFSHTFETNFDTTAIAYLEALLPVLHWPMFEDVTRGVADFIGGIFRGVMSAVKGVQQAVTDLGLCRMGSDDWQCVAGEMMKQGKRARPEYDHGNWWLNDDMWAWDPIKYSNGTWSIRGQRWDVFFRNHKLVDNQWVPGNYLKNETWYECMVRANLNLTKPKDCLNFTELHSRVLDHVTKPTLQNGTWKISNESIERFSGLLGEVNRFLPQGVQGMAANIEIKNGSVTVGNMSWDRFYGELKDKLLDFEKTKEADQVDCSKQGPWKASDDWQCVAGEMMKQGKRARPEYDHGNWWLNDDMWAWDPIEYSNGTWSIRGQRWDVFFRNHKLVDNQWVPGNYLKNETWYECMVRANLNLTKPKDCLNFTELHSSFLDHATKPTLQNGTWKISNVSIERFSGLLREVNRFLPQGVEGLAASVEIKNGSVTVGNMSWDRFYGELKDKLLDFEKMMEADQADCSKQDPWKGYEWECKLNEWVRGEAYAVPTYKFGEWWLLDTPLEEVLRQKLYWREDRKAWYIKDLRWDRFVLTHKFVKNVGWVRGIYDRSETIFGCLNGPWMNNTRPEKCVDIGELEKGVPSNPDPPVFVNGTWMFQGISWKKYVRMVNASLTFRSVQLERIDDHIDVVNGTLMVGDKPWDVVYAAIRQMVSSFATSLDAAVADCSNQDPTDGEELTCVNGRFLAGEVTYNFGTVWIGDFEWPDSWGRFEFRNGQWFVDSETLKDFFLNRVLTDNVWVRGVYPRKDTVYDCIVGPWMNRTENTRACVDIAGIISQMPSSAPRLTPVNGTWQATELGMSLKEIMAMLRQVMSIFPPSPRFDVYATPRYVNETLMIGRHTWPQFFDLVRQEVLAVDPNDPAVYSVDCANYNPSNYDYWRCVNGVFTKGEYTATPKYQYGTWWLLDDAWPETWEPWNNTDGQWYIGEYTWDEYMQTHKIVEGRDWYLNTDPIEGGESWFDCFDNQQLLDSYSNAAKNCIDFDLVRDLYNSPDSTPTFVNGTWKVFQMTWNEFVVGFNRTMRMMPVGSFPPSLNLHSLKLTLKGAEVFVGDVPWTVFFEQVVYGLLKFENTYIGSRLSCTFDASAGGAPKCKYDCAGECDGAATEDDCGTCSGGVTGVLPNERKDCTGECFGSARLDEECGICFGRSTNYTYWDMFDCEGTCVSKGGNKVVDCWGVCGGTATINNCGACVGGETGRPNNFGIDQCGVCIKSEYYFQSWDCNNDCNGNATWDWCANTCVGGLTGYAEDAFDSLFDCNGNCNGTFVVDSCGYCSIVNKRFAPYGSLFKDCSGTCFEPAEWHGPNWAYNDTSTCNECTGGSTGKSQYFYRDECGICHGDNSTCADCAGVPWGGSRIDACGVCGGDGSSCVAVQSVSPRYIEADTQGSYTLVGAGFTADTSCVFTPSSGSPIDIVPYFTNRTHLRCFASLPAQTYAVTALIGSTPVSASDATQTTVLAYDRAAIVVNSVSPSEYVLPKGGQNTATTVNVTLTGSFLPIVGCVFIGPSFGRIFREAQTGSTSSSLTCSITLPIGVESTLAFVYPTYDGFSGVGSPSMITLYREKPNLLSATFSTAGSSLEAVFDSKVDAWGFPCSDIFENADILGRSSQCFQATMRKVKIFLGASPTVSIGSELVLRNNTIGAIFEEYPKTAYGSVAVSGPASTKPPKAKISGPSFISSCDHLFLSGARSRGGGGRKLNSYWQVSSSNGSGVALIQDSLNSQNGSLRIFVNGSLMDQDATYTFTLLISNFLAPQNFVNTTHDVVREGVVKPRVQIFAAANVENLRSSDKFVMKADVELSSCASLAKLNYQWSSPTDGVTFNVATRTRRFYFVRANDLPAGKTITFTVEVTIPSQPGIKSTASITLTTRSTPLVPVISGGAYRTVGRDSGDVVIDGSLSSDPDNEAVKMTYVWSCKQVSTSGSCLSIKPGENSISFPTTSEKNQAVLTFDALRMRDNEIYEFTLSVTKLTRTTSTSVLIQAVAGQPPKMTFGSSTPTVVKPAEVVTLQISIDSVTEVLPSGVTWESLQLTGYGFVNLTDESKLESPVLTQRRGQSNSYISIIQISGASLSKGSSYTIQVSVNNTEGKNSSAKTEFQVLPGVTSCIFQASNYTELEEVSLETENCFAPEESLPITYKYGYIDGTEYKTLTTKSIEPVAKVFGKKPPSGNLMTFFVEVCDNYGVCSTIVSPVVGVAQKTTFSTKDIADTKSSQVDGPASIGDNVKAMGNLATLDAVLKAAGESLRRKRSVHSRSKRAVAPTNSSTTATTMLQLTSDFIQSSTLTREDVFLVLEQIDTLVVSETNAADQLNLLNYLDTLVTFLADKNGMDKAHADIVINKLNELLEYSANNKFVIFALEEVVMKAMTFDLSFGGAAMEVKAKSNPRVDIYSRYNTLAETFTSSSSANATVVDFGSELASTYLNWACGGSSTCFGAVGKFRHYATEIDDKSTSTNDINNRASDLVEISLVNPYSGDDLVVQNLTTPIQINMTITKPKTNSVYTCYYWDTTSNAWNTTDVTTEASDSTATSVKCLSKHLSLFVVIASPLPPTTTVAASTTNSNAVTGSGVTTGSGQTASVQTSTQTSGTTTQAATAQTTNNLGLLIGIVVGGVVIIAALIVVTMLVLRMYKKKAKVGVSDSSLNERRNDPRLQDDAFANEGTQHTV